LTAAIGLSLPVRGSAFFDFAALALREDSARADVLAGDCTAGAVARFGGAGGGDVQPTSSAAAAAEAMPDAAQPTNIL